MLYCKKCRILTHAPCAICGRKADKLAEPDGNDAVLLISCRLHHASMIEPLLNDSGIPCYRDGALGAALSMTFGSYVELYHLYVPYALYHRAYELISALFADDSEVISRLADHGMTEEEFAALPKTEESDV